MDFYSPRSHITLIHYMETEIWNLIYPHGKKETQICIVHIYAGMDFCCIIMCGFRVFSCFIGRKHSHLLQGRHGSSYSMYTSVTRSIREIVVNIINRHSQNHRGYTFSHLRKWSVGVQYVSYLFTLYYGGVNLTALFSIHFASSTVTITKLNSITCTFINVFVILLLQTILTKKTGLYRS